MSVFDMGRGLCTGYTSPDDLPSYIAVHPDTWAELLRAAGQTDGETVTFCGVAIRVVTSDHMPRGQALPMYPMCPPPHLPGPRS